MSKTFFSTADNTLHEHTSVQHSWGYRLRHVSPRTDQSTKTQTFHTHTDTQADWRSHTHMWLQTALLILGAVLRPLIQTVPVIHSWQPTSKSSKQQRWTPIVSLLGRSSPLLTSLCLSHLISPYLSLRLISYLWFPTLECDYLWNSSHDTGRYEHWHTGEAHSDLFANRYLRSCRKAFKWSCEICFSNS